MIDLIIREHDSERMYLNIIEQTIRDYEGGKQDGSNWLAIHISKYIHLQIGHIHKEDRILFPIIENNLSQDRKSKIVKAMADFEKISSSTAWDNEFRVLMRRLEKEHSIIRPAVKGFKERRERIQSFLYD